MASSRIIWNGNPGEVWRNTGETIRYQLICQFRNSCGFCVQYHLAISNWWPLKFHDRCRCRQLMVPPGSSAQPFEDFRDIIDKMSWDQKVAAVGASNYKLLEHGVITWDDIVTETRVRDFREVVAGQKLSVETMIKAGVRPQDAELAFKSVHTPKAKIIKERRAELVARLRDAGLSDAQIKEGVARKIAQRISTTGGRGETFVRTPKPPSTLPPDLLDLINATAKANRTAFPIGPKPPPATLPLPASVAKKILDHEKAIEAIKPKPPAPPIEPPPEAPVRHPAEPTPGEPGSEGPIGESLPGPMFKLKKGPKPKGPPKPKVAPFPKSGDNMDVVKPLGGSTGAKLIKGPDGKLYVAKKGVNPGHLREEAAADELYRKLGFDVPRSKVYERPDGPLKLSEFIEGKTLGELKHADPVAYEAALKELRKGFVADALLGNWDVVGASADNILVTPSGQVLRVDNGGSLRYRAQGALKTGSQWSATVGELGTMRDPHVSAGAGQIYKSVTEKEVLEQIKAIVRKRTSILKAAPTDVRDILGKRIDYLRDYAKNAGKPPKIGNWKPSPESSFRKFTSTTDADAWAKSHYGAWAKGLTKDEKDAISAYKHSDYTTINNHHRAPGSSGNSDVMRYTAELDKALAKNPLKESVVTIRYFRLADVNLTYNQVRVGADIIDQGYTSTSVNPHHVWSGHRFEVRVPEGTEAGYVKLATSSHQSEYELLLGRSASRFRVVELKQDAAKTIVLEVVPDKPKVRKK